MKPVLRNKQYKSYKPLSNPRDGKFRFKDGKHKGKTLDEVKDTDYYFLVRFIRKDENLDKHPEVREYYESGNITLPDEDIIDFGNKFQGQSINDVFEKDKQYLDFCVSKGYLDWDTKLHEIYRGLLQEYKEVNSISKKIFNYRDLMIGDKTLLEFIDYTIMNKLNNTDTTITVSTQVDNIIAEL